MGPHHNTTLKDKMRTTQERKKRALTLHRHCEEGEFGERVSDGRVHHKDLEWINGVSKHLGVFKYVCERLAYSPVMSMYTHRREIETHRDKTAFSAKHDKPHKRDTNRHRLGEGWLK